jgi:hypothetical protein
MKLRYLATVVVLALTTVAAHAQVGLYFNPIAIRVSNSVPDNGPFAFLGQNSTSNVFYGYTLGGYYDFYHAGKLNAGFDMRFADLHANNAMLKTFVVGVRVAGQPTTRPFKPYLEAAIGAGYTKAPVNTVHIRKPDYALYAGVDYSFSHHVDFRMLELGYSSLITVSSATVGAGGDIAIPASNLLSFSTGLVFHF